MNQKLYSVDIRKIFIAIPLVIIFLSNIFITQIKGLAFIGEIAVIAGLSSLGAIFIGLSTDAIRSMPDDPLVLYSGNLTLELSLLTKTLTINLIEKLFY